MYLPFHPCRRIGTDAAKQWLCKLKEEEVPVLVCLTHADRLYADLIRNLGTNWLQTATDWKGIAGMSNEVLFVWLLCV